MRICLYGKKLQHGELFFFLLLNRHQKTLSTAGNNTQVYLEQCMDEMVKNAEICSADLLLLFIISTKRKKQCI